MIAINKQDFIENWEEQANQFKRLGSTAESLKTFEAIQKTVADLKMLIRKVADEGYPEGDILSKAKAFGTEADENQSPFSEYKEDICIIMQVEKWSEISLKAQLDIKAAFKKGREDNKIAQSP